MVVLHRPSLGVRNTSTSRSTTTTRHQSTRANPPTPVEGSSSDEAPVAVASATQPFVQTRLQSGEWDWERTDPLYRPKFRSNAKILAEEDFANRPTVGLNTEFESFQDAMVTLGWITHAQQAKIYQLYLELLQQSHHRHNVTSHEYVIRVLAQKFNLAAERVAGIVQLQHNEAQYAADPNHPPLRTDLAEYMDESFQHVIEEAYENQKLTPPSEFVEDPIGVVGKQESKSWRVAEDLLDLDQVLEDTATREEMRARLIIDGHIYREDVDDDNVPIPMSKEAKLLLKAHRRFQEKSVSGAPKEDEQKLEAKAQVVEDATVAVVAPDGAEDWGEDGVEDGPDDEPEDEVAEDGAESSESSAPPKPSQRPRWQYVAQIVNTRELHMKRSKHRSYINNSPADTLVEHDGTLRVATMADVKHTAWKPTRNVLEHTYQWAKQGWLDKTVRGDESAWGAVPPVHKPHYTSSFPSRGHPRSSLDDEEFPDVEEYPDEEEFSDPDEPM